MIEITFNKDLPFSIFSFRHWGENGHERLSVLVKGTFMPDPNGRLITVRDKPDILFEDQFSGKVNMSSLRQESDIAPFKPKTDISFNAIARSPEARELTSWPIRIDIAGRLSYNFHVTGQRFFEPQKNNSKGNKYWGVSDMEKTIAVPLDYEHSYGGTVKISDEDVKSYPYNPVGMGLVSDYLLEKDTRIAIAQIGILAELNEPKPDKEMTICGLAPVVKSWLPRLALAGKFDENWLNHRHPMMPEDFDPNYWNAAPRPLQATPYLRGNEILRLSGLSHVPHPISLALPGAGIGAKVHRHSVAQEQLMSLQLDTLHGDVRSDNRSEHRFTLIWRAVVENPDDIAAIILHPQALTPIAPALTKNEAINTADKTRENKESQDILQSRRGNIDQIQMHGAHQGTSTSLATLADGVAPLFSVLLAKGGEADFHIHEQEGKVIITQAGAREIIHIGHKDFIYAEKNAAPSAKIPHQMPYKINDRVTLYVRLIEEEVLVWRPVVAHWHGGKRFYIALQNVPAGEIWQFRPDKRVTAEWRHFNGGDYLVATALSDY